MKILSLTLLLLVSACGNSPLFNHKTESDSGSGKSVVDERGYLEFKKTDFAFTVTWEEGPQLGSSQFIMKTWNKKLGTISGPYQDLPKDLSVFLWMPAMGHGSAPVKLQKINDGEYKVSEVQFLMGGKWEVKFQLKDGGQVFDETVISVSL